MRTGTGFLLHDGLVLTAAHVVPRDTAAFVRLRPSSGLLKCEVVWRRYDSPAGTGVDAALLRIGDDTFDAPRQPVRWGKVVTAAPCPVVATGFPVAMELRLRGRLEYRDAAQIRGELLPSSRVKAGRYEISVTTPVPVPVGSRSADTSRWAGMSGAGVCADGALVAIVAADSDAGGAGLTAIPVTTLLADPAFRRLVGDISLEPVELAALIERAPALPRSPIGLLRAEHAAVRFRGRDDLVASLRAWADDERGIDVMLVTAPAGSGKTRLAHELVRALRQVGWCAGFLDALCRPDLIGVVAESIEPVLLVVDYAETRVDQLRALIHLMEQLADRALSPIRLLLLARGAGEWWSALRSATRLLRVRPMEDVISLPDLLPDYASRVAAFRAAVTELAGGIAVLPGSDGVDVEPIDIDRLPLDRPEFVRALPVQMAALAAVLQRRTPVEIAAGATDEEVLLRHEERFWADTAAVHRIAHLHPNTLRQLVTVATLCPVVSSADATNLLRKLALLKGETANVLTAAAAWLRDLYGADGRYWDALVPDALGEYLVGTVEVDFGGLLDDLAEHVSGEQAVQMLTVLCRASERFPALSDRIVRYVLGRPRPMAFAAIAVTARGEHRIPCHALNLLVTMPALDAALVDDLLQATPSHTISLAEWAVSAATRLVDMRVAGTADDGHRLASAGDALQHLAFRLAETGRHDQALTHAVEMVRLRREAVARFGATPDGLVEALLSYGARLAAVGQLERAVRAGGEAIALCRSDDLWTDQVRLSAALHHYAIWLHESGRCDEAERAGGAAVRARAELARQDERYRAELANSSTNYAYYLQDVGRPEEGLPYALNAVDTYQLLVREAPDTYTVTFGRALINLARLLAGLDRVDEALDRAAEAVRVCRQLLREDTANPRAELVVALANYGRRLAAVKRFDDAIQALEEAEELTRKLAVAGPDRAQSRLTAIQNDLRILRRLVSSG
ncbi:trypsin-like peptidase domain-containing protein [Actinokineospora fastidiosa]|uniref:Novel STAND NTPase 5 domain-containing protein n=1 Tax=Actinokineospora fastidiosa TaxID=1816 RepID=A0A918LI53_9PSEU|nr:trypsin-like peptidase domain-containing protein [Actinokineospora fastidiosa]GGS54712.1 hypothetical protein GCM10010171_57330 [Actinokineospora fastidiosa]